MYKSRINKNKFIYYYNQGLNDREIGEYLNMSSSAIQFYRTQILKLPKHSRKAINQQQLQKLLFQKKSNKDIAKILGLHTSTISRYRKEFNLQDISKRAQFYQYTEAQWQVILGSILGDGHLEKHYLSGGTILRIAHCDKQLSYLEFKHEILKTVSWNIKHYQRLDNRLKMPLYNRHEFYTKSSLSLNGLYERWYTPTKTIYKDDLYKIQPLGLAIWFMDDGYKVGNGGMLSTNCFSMTDLAVIKEMFKSKFNIDVTIYEKRHLIYFPVKEFKKLVEIIKPYIISCMQYKIESHSKTPLNGETPVIVPEKLQDNPVLNLSEMTDNA